jgi:hypothetical protein
MQGPDARIAVDLPPSMRGPTDGSVDQVPDSATIPDTSTLPPPPADAATDVARDVARPVDVAPPVDVRTTDVGMTVMDAAPDLVLGQRCNVALGNCPNSSYCYAPACGANGNCVAADTGAQQDPLCGCDRITYWNGAVAAASNASIRALGACPADLGTACGAGVAAQCPLGSQCNLEQANDAACVANATGHCWTLPAACPALPAGTRPTTRRCVGGGANPPCMSACDLISAGRIFRVDDTCP